MKILQKIGQRLARHLSEPRKYSSQVATSTLVKLRQSLLPGDILLVDGNSSFSAAIKYLTQSSWSHAALFIGEVLPCVKNAQEQPLFIEADINEGVRAVGISLYAPLHTRICRPVGLKKNEITTVVNYAVDRLGYKYDLRNIIDLARYLLPTPPIPQRFRRRFLSLGSGDPSLAICSSLIAQAFQSTILFYRKLLCKDVAARHAKIAVKKYFISVITAYLHREILMFHLISKLLNPLSNRDLIPTNFHGVIRHLLLLIT